MRTDKKRFSTRLAAAVMAGTLAVGMMGMSVFAEGSSEIKPVESTSYIEGTGGDITIPLKKDVQTDGNTYAPDTTFEFIVTPVAVTDAPQDTSVPTNGITASGITYTNADGLGIDKSIIKNGGITINKDAFTKVGVYKYTISEKEGGYEGIDYDDKTYDVYVTVVNNEEGTGVYPKYVKVVNTENKNEKVKEIVFTNDYGKKIDSTHDVTIKKIITGNQSIATDTFNVKVSVKAWDNKNEAYKVVYIHNGTTKTDKINSGEIKTYPVTNNTTIHIYGLTERDVVTAVEDVNQKGYTATYSKAKVGEWESVSLINNGVSILKDDAQATVTNTKDATIPTGIVLNYGPYILMIALAGSMAVFFFRRKNHKEA